MRVWLDLTGIVPGSDAALLAQCLAPSLHALLGERLVLCRREPGLVRLEPTALASLAAPPRPTPRRNRFGWVARLAVDLPPATRTGLRRALRLQMAVLRALRPIRPAASTPAASLVDQESPSRGDTLLMLLPRGDVSRFHHAGVFVAALLAETLGLDRPDLLDSRAAADVAQWKATSLGVTHPLLTLGEMGLPAAATAAVAGARTLPPDFVLADGHIGMAGGTHTLLLAWRRLLETVPDAVPHLVLAGPLGPLADDLLVQLRNSHCFAGAITLAAGPSEAERAALRRDCRLVLELELGSWGRAALDAAQAGKPCLSMAVPDAAALAVLLQRWLVAPPPSRPPSSRNWHDVARDLAAALGA